MHIKNEDEFNKPKLLRYLLFALGKYLIAFFISPHQHVSKL